MYDRLNRGQIINKNQETTAFNVDEKTVRRDIEDLRTYLADANLNHSNGSLSICYDKKLNGYVLSGDNSVWLTNEEVLLIVKIVLESRALPREELNQLLDKIMLQCIPEEREHIKKVILNERYHYVPVNHGQPLGERIWQLSYAVREHRLVDIEYQKIGHPTAVKRMIEPVGIIFSEYYFYLIGYIAGYGYEFPAVYRLDRIKNFVVTDSHFYIPDAQRFEEGEFRKRVQFMHPGSLMRIQFRFWGPSLEAVLDRLPTAKVLSIDKGSALIEAEVFGRGIKMWLLSQAQYLEVIKPEDFRAEMKQTIQAMLNNYN
ncbi:WYL domain-containing protein [Peptococcaceae bacterium 1198_IL3148]